MVKTIHFKEILYMHDISIKLIPKLRRNLVGMFSIFLSIHYLKEAPITFLKVTEAFDIIIDCFISIGVDEVMGTHLEEVQRFDSLGRSGFLQTTFLCSLDETCGGSPVSLHQCS